MILTLGTGTVNEDLSALLELNLSKPKGGSSIVLGVSEPLPANAIKSTLGLKCDVNRVDNMIIQAIALLDQLDKDVNLFSMRIRE